MAPELGSLILGLTRLVESRWKSTISFLSDAVAHDQHGIPYEQCGTPSRNIIHKVNGEEFFLVPLYNNSLLLGALHISANENITKTDAGDISDVAEAMIRESIALREELTRNERALGHIFSNTSEISRYGDLITRNKDLKQQWEILDNRREETTPILISGERGTGKRQLAKNFSDLCETSELHIYTAETQLTQSGLVRMEGILIIHLLENLPQSEQTELARFLKTQRLNSELGPRVIAISELSTSQMEQNGNFSRSLLYALNQIIINTTPLRNRHDDILLLINHRLEETSQKRLSISDCTPLTIVHLMDYSWPGNVADLFEVIDDMVRHAKSVPITIDLLPERVIGKATRHVVKIAKKELLLNKAIEKLERELILDSLNQSNWNKSKVSKELGISRSGLIHKVEKYKLEPLPAEAPLFI